MLEYKSCVTVKPAAEHLQGRLFLTGLCFKLEIGLKETYAFNGRFTRRA